MKSYRFIELKSMEVSLPLATEYHNQPDTYIYLTKLQKSDFYNAQYHYKIYRLHNNELSMPVHLILRNNLVFNLTADQSREIAISIDYWIEKDKRKENKMEHGTPDMLGHIFTIAVTLDQSGAILLERDNLNPEVSSPTQEPRQSNAALTLQYGLANRRNNPHPLAIEEDKMPEQSQPWKPANEYLTYFYRLLRNRGDDNRLTVQDNDEKKRLPGSLPK